jgi:hypothetical protein
MVYFFLEILVGVKVHLGKHDLYIVSIDVRRIQMHASSVIGPNSMDLIHLVPWAYIQTSRMPRIYHSPTP